MPWCGEAPWVKFLLQLLLAPHSRRPQLGAFLLKPFLDVSSLATHLYILGSQEDSGFLVLSASGRTDISHRFSLGDWLYVSRPQETHLNRFRALFHVLLGQQHGRGLMFLRFSCTQFGAGISAVPSGRRFNSPVNGWPFYSPSPGTVEGNTTFLISMMSLPKTFSWTLSL